MPTAPRVECNVVFATDTLRVGEFANAFRVMADSPTEVLLDFCVYSASANVAKVVSRVRIPKEFLSLVDTRLREAVAEFEALLRTSDGPTMRDGLLVNREGMVVLFGNTSEGDN